MDVLVGIVCLAVGLAIYFAPAAWAVGDAQKRGQGGGVVFLLFWLFGPFAALIWLAVRPRTKVVDRSPDDYTNPGDALAAAARLDELGEWDAAITLYDYAAKCWPEQQEYIRACIEDVKSETGTAPPKCPRRRNGEV